MKTDKRKIAEVISKLDYPNCPVCEYGGSVLQRPFRDYCDRHLIDIYKIWWREEVIRIQIVKEANIRGLSLE